MVIHSIQPGSLAERLGLMPGDRVERVNGERVRDLLDFHFKMAEEQVLLETSREGSNHTHSLRSAEPGDLGLRFEEMKIRTCGNECVFCFIDQNPTGMRETLYVKDEDYRLSFLHGNFVTLSNMKDWEIRRIAEQRLSPIYISVHSTNRETRQRMIRARKERDILPILEYFRASDIQMHTQIVLCPGYNDGDDLRQTVEDLAAFYPSIQSLAIVPLGTTAHRDGLADLAPVTPELAERTLNEISAYQERYRERHGVRFVYMADEWYRLLGRTVPAETHYDGFPQIENGIGMTRHFLNRLGRMKKLFPEASPEGTRRITLVTGALFRETLEDVLRAKLARSREAVEPRVVGVPNDFFGRKVTVAGLLTGRDILRTLADADPGDLVVLPPSTLNESDVFLDDLTLREFEEQLSVPVQVGFRNRQF